MNDTSLSPALVAESEQQKLSLAELSTAKKYAQYNSVTEDNLQAYHAISCRPITKKAENDMELLSDIITWGERYLHHWESGSYNCSRCANTLYSSCDKYKGPCVWPSFRKPLTIQAISVSEVSPYNGYSITVKEIYCGNCDLFVGHQFEDGKCKGDTHPEAHWRH